MGIITRALLLLAPRRRVRLAFTRRYATFGGAVVAA